MESTPLIVALGNPGPQYESTRHNFGFLTAQAILDQAGERKSAALKTLQTAGDFELYSLVLGGVSCLLARPLTFMNLSGRAAAMRYTEARLTPIAELLLSEINMGTVDFVPNYDGAFEEPVHLPARLPMVLLNGASGIAVGMATEIPSHNLTEVTQAAIALLKKPSMTVADLMAYVPAPTPSAGLPQE